MAEHQDLLTAALIKAKKKFKPLTKSGHNKHRDYHYSTLKDLANATDGPLLDEGLTIMHYPFVGEGRVVGVKTELEHISGQKRSTSLALTPAGTDPQSAGSCISYAKRYNKEALLDIAGEDDDGVAASEDDSRATGDNSSGTVLTPKVMSPGDFIISWGNNKGKKVKELSSSQLIKDIKYWKDRSIAEKKPLTGAPLLFVQDAQAYLDSKADDSSGPPPLSDDEIPIPF